MTQEIRAASSAAARHNDDAEAFVTFTIGGQTRTLKPGEMWRIPGGVIHSAVAGDNQNRGARY